MITKQVARTTIAGLGCGLIGPCVIRKSVFLGDLVGLVMLSMRVVIRSPRRVTTVWLSAKFVRLLGHLGPDKLTLFEWGFQLLNLENSLRELSGPALNNPGHPT